MRLLCECETAGVNTGATDLDGSLYTAPGTGNNKQVIQAASGASATITLDMLDVLLSMVKPGATNLITNGQMTRKIASLARASGNNLSHDQDQLGFPVTRYGDVTVTIDDNTPVNFIDPTTIVSAPLSYTPTTAVSAGNDTIPIFAVRFGEDGLCGINGNGMINITPFDKLEGKDGQRTRIKFYAGMRLTNKLAAAVLMSATTT
jgi:hypothetical protein